MMALACSYLFTASVSSFAQSNNDPLASDAEMISSGNAASASLQRAFARAMMSALLVPEAMTGREARYLANWGFSPDQAQESTQEQAKPPANKPAAPSLPDLFPPSETRGNAREQALLDKRTHMLKIHQRLGLITIAPLLATIISSGGAAGKHSSTAGLDLHAALGVATTGLYFSTAYYAIFAPKLPGTTTRGPIRLHKGLAWVHGPGMILTGILGGLAYEQRSSGEKVHGIAKAHSAVGWVTAGAFGAAVLSVSIKL